MTDFQIVSLISGFVALAAAVFAVKFEDRTKYPRDEGTYGDLPHVPEF